MSEAGVQRAQPPPDLIMPDHRRSPEVDANDARALRAAPSLRWLETVCWCMGCVLLIGYGVARAAGEIGRHYALQAFAAGAPIRASSIDAASSGAAVDTSLWSTTRVQDYQQALVAVTERPLAILKVPAVKLEVPVYQDDSEPHLNRGAGLARGTPLPGHGGTLVIAGHRDGFFRVLKDVRKGDLIEVQTRGQLLSYRIRSIAIVDAKDNRLLADSDDSRVTLVTCYPFYHIGPAPKRYLVRGVQLGPAAESTLDGGPSS
jgi:sortase A